MRELPKCHICKEDAYPMKIQNGPIFQYAFRMTMIKGLPYYFCEKCFIEWNEISELLLDRFHKENGIQKGVIVI